MKKAIFFDLDGTLWNALTPIQDSWNTAMAKHGRHYRFSLEMITSYMGLTPEETAIIAFPDVTLEKGMEFFKECLDEEIKYLSNNPGTIYPHEKEILSELSCKYQLFIVSNCDKGYIENYLNALEMNEYFTDHTCIGDTGKPKWQSILYLKDKYNIDDIIYIGDTLKDKTESVKASVKFIHASYGFGVIDNKKYSITSLLQLPDLVELVFKI